MLEICNHWLLYFYAFKQNSIVYIEYVEIKSIKLINEGSRTKGIWMLIHLFRSSTIASKAMEQIRIFIPRWRMMQNTTVEQWTDSIRVDAIIITKDSFLFMRTILLIIRSITESLALYFKG